MENKVTVQAPCGQIWGEPDKFGVTIFKNIPFAKANRWQAPVRVEASGEPLGSSKYGPAPIQDKPDPFFAARSGELLEFPQSEDCLNLNVWVGDLSRPKKAVLFWVYGGSYLIGYNYKKGYLPSQFVAAHPEIVVVAPNYRVGVLGSLNLSPLSNDDTYRYSNNLALLDIVAALEWTKENISAFGADAGQVTMYGHSAGSNAISHLMAMPRAKGLFRRAICQSSYMSDLGTVALDTSVNVARKFFELTNAKTLEDALALTPEQIIAAQKQLFRFQYEGSKASKMFSPVADGVVVDEEPFLHFINGTFHGEQVMIGGSQGEYDQMFAKKDLAETKEFILARNTDKHITPGQVEAFVAMHPEMTEKEACMTIHNELGLSLGGEWIGRAVCQYVPTYEYAFCLRDPKEGCRAIHGAPCNYVFGTLVPENAPEGLKKQMMDTWAAFINTGNPNNAQIPEWPCYKPDGQVMVIDETWHCSDGYWAKDFDFWKNTFHEAKLMS